MFYYFIIKKQFNKYQNIKNALRNKCQNCKLFAFRSFLILKLVIFLFGTSQFKISNHAKNEDLIKNFNFNLALIKFKDFELH